MLTLAAVGRGRQKVRRKLQASWRAKGVEDVLVLSKRACAIKPDKPLATEQLRPLKLCGPPAFVTTKPVPYSPPCDLKLLSAKLVNKLSEWIDP